MRLENSFDVDAPLDASWRLLNDVPSVIPCLPGAELVDIVDERTWTANLRVKLGPIALQFTTEIVRESVDEAARRVVLSVNAREARGRGSAQAKVESTLAAADGRTRVSIVTELTLRGAVAQHGRTVVADVAARLTERFASCIAAKLADSAAPAPPPVPIGGLRLFLGALWRSLVGRVTTRR
ncbi:MAG: SRPBCC family protein [Gaiellaceae bacterium]